MKYEILASDSVDNLEQSVNTSLKEGWTLYGKPFACIDAYGFIWIHQAMTFEETEYVLE